MALESATSEAGAEVRAAVRAEGQGAAAATSAPASREAGRASESMDRVERARSPSSVASNSTTSSASSVSASAGSDGSLHDETAGGPSEDLETGEVDKGDGVDKEAAEEAAEGRKKKKKKCWDLSPQPLPVMQEGFWGTRHLMQVRCAENLRTKHGFWLLGLYTLAVLGGFFGLSYANYANVDGQDIGCTSRFWWNRSRVDDGCGIDAMDCRPLQTEDWSIGRCPSHCLTDWSRPVYGSRPYYGGNGMICASAIHAGVIPNARGGSFRYRLAGPQMSYEGSESNGVASEGFGWFPRSIEFEAVDDWNTNVLQSWLDVYVAAVMAVTLFFVRPDAWFFFIFLSTTGWLYLTTTRTSSDNFSQTLNSYSPRLLVILLMCYFLWPNAVRHTMPDPRRFPIDTALFYFLPFWMGIHLDVVLNWGISITFTSAAFSSFGYVVGFFLFFLVAIPVVIFQARALYRARLFFKALFYVLFTLLWVLVFTLSAVQFLSIHIHHWMVGGIGVLLLQGQHRSRFQIILQALMLGTLVNGVATWNIDPLYSSRSPPAAGPNLPGPSLYWTGVNITNTTLSLEWAPPSTVLDDWRCSELGLKAFVSSHLPEGADMPSVSMGSHVPSPGFATETKPVSRTAKAMSMTQSAADPAHAPLALKGRSLLRAFAAKTALAGPVPDDDDDTRPFRVTLSGTMVINRLFTRSDVYGAVIDTGLFGASLLLAAGNDSAETPYLPLTTPPDETTLVGGGIYDGTSATFVANPCARVYALLLAQP